MATKAKTLLRKTHLSYSKLAAFSSDTDHPVQAPVAIQMIGISATRSAGPV